MPQSAKCEGRIMALTESNTIDYLTSLAKIKYKYYNNTLLNEKLCLQM